MNQKSYRMMLGSCSRTFQTQLKKFKKSSVCEATLAGGNEGDDGGDQGCVTATANAKGSAHEKPTGEMAAGWMYSTGGADWKMEPRTIWTPF